MSIGLTTGDSAFDVVSAAAVAAATALFYSSSATLLAAITHPAFKHDNIGQCLLTTNLASSPTLCQTVFHNFALLCSQYSGMPPSCILYSLIAES